MKVLIVEDNEDSRNLLVKQLRAHGNEVMAAADGVEALEQALKEPPDILVTDILMPRMDGYQLCYEWKKNEKLKDIPFVFYTAVYTSSADEKFALSLGANTFIRKPTEPKVLARMLSEVFEKAKFGLLPAAEAAPPKPSLYLNEYNKRLVAKLNEKVAELEKSEEELRYLSSILGAIRNINQLIVREGDKTKLLQGACKIMLKVRDYRFVWVGLVEEGHKRVIPVARAGVEDSYLDKVEITWDDKPGGQGPAGMAIKTKKPDLIKNITETPRSGPWREEALKRGYRSSVAIPLLYGNKVFGMLNVYSSQPESFDDAELQLLVEVGSDLGFALKAIERREARQRAEGELEKERDRAQQYLDIAGVMIIVIGRDKRVELVNQKGCQILGCDEEEIIGKNWFRNCLPRRVRTEVESGFEKLVAGEIKHMEYNENPVLTKSGEERIIAWHNTIIRDDAGHVIATLSSGEDITERKRAEEALRESEARYRALIEGAHDMIQSVGLDGSIIFVNKSWLDTLGYTEAELSSLNMFDIIHPDSRAHSREMLAEIVKGKPVRNVETTLVAKDGRKILVEGDAAPRYIGKKVVASQGIFRDVTERRRAEAALADEATRRRILVDESSDGIVILDEDGKVYEANRRFAEMLGYTPEEVRELGVWDWEFQFPREQVAEMIRTVDETGDHFETQHRRKDGTVYDVEISTNGAIYAGRKLIFCVCRDITERKLAEEALRESNQRFTDIADNALQLIWEVDAKGKYTYVSPIVEKILGYKPEEVVGKDFYDLFHPDDRVEMQKVTFAAFAAKQPFRQFLSRLVHKNGEIVWILSSGVPILDETGKLLGYRGAVVDVTEREQAEAALRQSEEKLRVILESIPQGITVTDLEGKILQVNNAALRVHGYSTRQELIGRNSFELITKEGHARAADNLKKTLETGRSGAIEYILIRKDGTTFPAQLSAALVQDESAKPIGFVAVTEDITERRKMQEQLVITDRLASVGELAAGIAHELNNPLTGVIGFSQLLMDREMPEDIRQDIGVVYREAQRASQVVKNLLTFARKHTVTKQRVKINDVINKVLELRAYEQNLENIKVYARLDSELPEVMADYFQLQQVFLNIIINAEYFMKQAHRGGNLTITTERVDNNVRASIADDGPGIAKDALGHIFDPFFTTKEVGGGTGLGLSICHGIVAEHGGKIYVESELGKGATFIVELPIVVAEEKGGAA